MYRSSPFRSCPISAICDCKERWSRPRCTVVLRFRVYASMLLSRRYSARCRIAAEVVPSSSYSLDRL